MKKNRYTKSRRAEHGKDYILYKFPFLSILTGRGKLPFILVSMLLLISALYYTFFLKSPTENGVLDGLIGTPIQAMIVFVLFVCVVFLRIRFYKGTKGSLERNAVSHPSLSSYPWIPLTTNIENVDFDCSKIDNLNELHPILESAIQFTDFDKEDNFRLEAGTLNIPKCSLESIRIEQGRATLTLQSTSFYSIYYSHYFADYRLSRDSTDENNNSKLVSLRTVFAEYAEQYILDQVTETSKNNNSSDYQIYPYPIFPNPLGLTGICFYKEPSGEQVFIARYRGSNVINETNRLDWSFSGLVEAHPFIQARGSRPNLKDFVGIEFADELIAPIKRYAEQHKLNNETLSFNPISYSALGLIFNGKYLFQPELIVMMELDLNANAISILKKYAATGRLKLISEGELCNSKSLGPSKDLFLPIKGHLVEYLDNSNRS